MRHKATPETTENNSQSGPTPKPDFFQDLYGKSGVRIIGGGKTTREQLVYLLVFSDKDSLDSTEK